MLASQSHVGDAMHQIQFTVNGRQYQCNKLNAFDAHKLVMKLVKALGPALNGLSLDAEVSTLLAAIGNAGDPISDIALPLFADSLMMVDGQPLRTQHDVNARYTADDIGDLYEAAVLAVKHQVGPAFTNALTRFGARS